MKLNFITKGNRNLRGKSKIYFCGHPSDYGAPFQNIVNDILEMPNCAIWYDTEPEADWNEEQYFYDISGMQLFVMIVTRNFLYEKNRAFSKELPFALENHIPILPIIENNQLEHAFKEKCGNLQSLKKVVRGPDAMPYKDRLKKFLNRVLIGDKLSQRILESFDAEIFLAYRKEDRKFAHQFMQAVHENAHFRNISIWYDEFLNIGNNYSAEIDEAIQNSSAFAMIVTPNILTNGSYNYVREQEYPAAVRLKKKIIPVEFMKVNPDELKKDYKGISDCILIDNSSELYDALESAFAEKNLMQNADEPQCQFLLGLAYLGGIGLEKNLKYAFPLILSAAESDLPEAIERLVTMYYYGEAVSRNLSAAITWQSRLVEYYKCKYEETGERESGIHVVFEQHKLYEYYMEDGNVAAAGELIINMKRFSSKLRKKYPRDYSCIECLVISLTDVSDFLYKQNDFREAKKIRRLLLIMNKLLAHDTGIFDAKEDLMINYQQLGIVSEEKGDFKAALKYYQESLAISEKMKDEDGSDTLYRRWLDDLYRVGHCYLRLGSIKESETYLKNCLKGYTSLSGEKPELWHIYDALSKVYCQKFQLDKAGLYCDRSILLAKQSSNLKSKRNLADSYSFKANILTAAKQYSDAESNYLLALKLMHHILEKTGEYEDKERIWITCGMFGDCCLQVNNTAKAKVYYQKSMKEIVSLHPNDRKWQANISYAQGCQRLGFVACREGNYGLARRHFKNSIIILNRMKKQSSDFVISIFLKAAKIALKELNTHS